MQQRPQNQIPLVEALRRLLTTQRFGRSARGYASVASTNTLAAEWAAEGAPEGSIVLAEYQTMGRGRLGRAWSAAPGVNVMFSVILHPRLEPDQLGLLTAAGAVAIAEAVEHAAAPASVRIKWPNDVLLNGRKCCGMLLESGPSSHATHSSRHVVAGIGVNVNQDAFPPELAESATSLLLETGRLTDRAAFLADLLLRFERGYDLLHRDAAAVRHAFLGRMAFLGERVAFRLSATSEAVEGTVLGLTESGSLLLETAGGRRTFHAGEITSQIGS